jgi:hypothetical protein
MDENEVIELLKNPGNYDDQRDKLANYLNELIQNDFNQLINLLYRIDIDEQKLKKTLKENSGDAGLLFAELIIQRQLQKVKTRKEYGKNE